MTKGEKRSYVSWRSMIQRYYNPNFKFYKDYGGRGITVCSRWRQFKNFLADMGERPPGMTLERRNNNLGYFKANNYWASRRQQANNRRKALYDHVRPARLGWGTRRFSTCMEILAEIDESCTRIAI
jgi:hypothetical protein